MPLVSPSIEYILPISTFQIRGPGRRSTDYQAPKEPRASYGFDGTTVFILEIDVSESQEAHVVVKREGYFTGVFDRTAIQTAIYVFAKDLDDKAQGGPRLVTLDYYHILSQRDEEGKYPGKFRRDCVIYSETPPASYGTLHLSLSDFVAHHVLEEVYKLHPEFVPPTVLIALDSFYGITKKYPYRDEPPSGQSRGEGNIVEWEEIPSGADADSEAEEKGASEDDDHGEEVGASEEDDDVEGEGWDTTNVDGEDTDTEEEEEDIF
ncbi:hypothetical protein EG328_010316 [Venturia inaequalis]|uniref:Uncharacterized protein n=1 Tax=Venturia inaequalis TaxID=5025 RepID=A0A8H3Z2Q0_VENIN|nr:hypothetical protein EG328_010316 [Venturia inaequalis]